MSLTPLANSTASDARDVQPTPDLENPAMKVPFELTGRSVLQGFTCGCSQGKEEGGSSLPAEAELGCKAAGGAREGTSRSRRCMAVEDLSSRNRKK